MALEIIKKAVDKTLGALANAIIGMVSSMICGIFILICTPFSLLFIKYESKTDLFLDLFLLLCVGAFFLLMFAPLSEIVSLIILLPAAFGVCVVAGIAVWASVVTIINLFQDLRTGFTHGLSSLFTHIKWEYFFFRWFPPEIVEEGRRGLEIRRVSERRSKSIQLLKMAKLLTASQSLVPYAEKMLTQEELKEFKQAIDADPEESVKKKNQSLYDYLISDCPISLASLMDKNNPPITLVGQFPDPNGREYYKTYNYTSFISLINNAIQKNTPVLVPDTKDPIDSPYIDIFIGFHEVDFDCIRREIKKWKERIAATPADIESKEEEVSQRTAVHHAAELTTSTAVVSAPDPDIRAVATSPSSPRSRGLSLDGLRAAGVAHFNFPQENNKRADSNGVTLSTSPSL
ncbi:MAG: hypothetical protein K0R24_2197 [Gammaproteobacteria bacterium]|jgi:hypothetical protein|nr:hypothetical protein [Gammaproteobacteria bacterium]